MKTANEVCRCTGAVLVMLGSYAVLGQQSLFNVPSSDITEKGEWFFQEQVNFTSSGISNTTIDYGLGNNLEVGINFFGVDFYHPRGASIDPEALLNVQKRLDITETWGVGIGTQVGALVPLHHDRTEFSNLSYVSNELKLGSFAKAYGGGFFANDTYTGSREQAGFMLGMEIPISEQHLHFMADYMQSSTSIGVGVVGWVVFLPHRWNFSVGAQLPAIRSHNAYGLVLEFTRM